MNEDPDHFKEDDPIVVEQDLCVPDTLNQVRENLLLVSGLCLVLLAAGMALTNLFS